MGSSHKKLLIIARAFPPFHPVGYSIRAIKFIKYMPVLGWQPVVLTIDDQVEYETTLKVGSATLLSEISTGVKIFRTPSGEPSQTFLDREKEFGRKNKLAAVLIKIIGGARRWMFRKILPDRYLPWMPYAVKFGLQIVNNENIDIIFATMPPYTSALIGACLKLLTKKPLILDFRDDWIDTPWFKSKPFLVRKIESAMERWAVKTADKVVLVTEWSRKAFLERYPSEPRDKFILIPNGCDLEEFSEAGSAAEPAGTAKFTIFHAGTLTVSKHWGRNPAGLFQAIGNILQEQSELAGKLSLVFAGDLPEEYQKLAAEMGLSEYVVGLGHLPHDEVVRLTKSSDLLLAMNYGGWATLIPGKIYEYWAAGGPPILLLSCPGAAASLIEQHSLGFSSDPSDVAGIQQAILDVYAHRKAGSPIRISTVGIEAYDRRELTAKLVQVLSEAH